MCNICVFAGTTEGRELVEFLAGQPVLATVCVATEYGETLLPEAENITILAGRIPVEDIIRMLQRTRLFWRTASTVSLTRWRPSTPAATRSGSKMCIRDRFCTVFIGNSAAKTVAGQLITPRGYRNV